MLGHGTVFLVLLLLLILDRDSGEKIQACCCRGHLVCNRINQSFLFYCRAKPVYVGGQLIYSVGMVFMAISRSWWGVLIFSWSAGVMYSTLFTMPYLIIAHYHETNTVCSTLLIESYIAYQQNTFNIYSIVKKTDTRMTRTRKSVALERTSAS